MATCQGLFHLWYLHITVSLFLLTFPRIATGPLADDAATGSTMDGIGITMVSSSMPTIFRQLSCLCVLKLMYTLCLPLHIVYSIYSGQSWHSVDMQMLICCVCRRLLNTTLLYTNWCWKWAGEGFLSWSCMVLSLESLGHVLCCSSSFDLDEWVQQYALRR